MAKYNFLFVNKTAGSSSLSNSTADPSLASRINQHSHKHAKRKTKQPVSTAARRLVGWQAKEKPPPAGSTDPQGNSREKQQEQDLHRSDSTKPLVLIPPPDSAVGSVRKLSAAEAHILQYFVTVWMPSDVSRSGHQLTGFTPVASADGRLCDRVVSGALQSDDSASLDCLLSVVSHRIRILNHDSPEEDSLPEQFSWRAVKSLRESITQTHRTQKPSPRIILDISYLILAELYRPPPSRSLTFRNLNRDLVVAYGGLHVLDPFVAQAALAYEYFTAQNELSVPLLDPVRDQRLMGVAADLPDVDARKLAAQRISTLELRIRILVEDLQYLTQIVEGIQQQFPSEVVRQVIEFARNNTIHQHQLNAAALEQTSLPPTGATSSSDGRGLEDTAALQSTIMTADALYMHLRQQAHRIWLWHTALAFYHSRSASTPRTFLSTDPPSPSAAAAVPTLDIETPAFISRDTSAMAGTLARIADMLATTGWGMRKEMVLWISALGVLVSQSMQDHSECARWLARTACELDINDDEDDEDDDDVGGLEAKLAIHFPLEHLRPKALDKLYEVVRMGELWWRDSAAAF